MSDTFTKAPYPGMSRGLTLLFAVASGIAVGNLYWAQPLLGAMATSLGITLGQSGSLITVTQIGYALGVLLLVPLGDTLNRRRFIPSIVGSSALALIGSAMAPGYWALIAGLSLVGLTSLSGQLLLPLTGDLAKDDQRGRVIGTIASGMLIGIMLSRFISELMADALGWRSIYLAAGVTNIGLAALVASKIPKDRPRPAITYGGLLLSIIAAVRSSRPVQITLVLGACSFAVFTMFWTGLTFLLSSPPFSYSVTQIGLVNLAGLAGAIAVKGAGGLHDRGHTTVATGAMLVVALAALGIGATGQASIIFVLISIVLINLAIQAVMVLNQTRLLTIRPELRSRLNTAFVVCNFAAGATGSALAGYLWQEGGCFILVGGQAAIIFLALIVWTAQRGGLRETDLRRAPS